MGRTAATAASRRIVVGVAGSAASAAAVTWAAREAELRGAVLHAVHAWEPAGRGRAPYAPGPHGGYHDDERAAAALLRTVVEQGLDPVRPGLDGPPPGTVGPLLEVAEGLGRPGPAALCGRCRDARARRQPADRRCRGPPGHRTGPGGPGLPARGALPGGHGRPAAHPAAGIGCVPPPGRRARLAASSSAGWAVKEAALRRAPLTVLAVHPVAVSAWTRAQNGSGGSGAFRLPRSANRMRPGTYRFYFVAGHGGYNRVTVKSGSKVVFIQ